MNGSPLYSLLLLAWPDADRDQIRQWTVDAGLAIQHKAAAAGVKVDVCYQAPDNEGAG